jgi:hypothetical protein
MKLFTRSRSEKYGINWQAVELREISIRRFTIFYRAGPFSFNPLWSFSNAIENSAVGIVGFLIHSYSNAVKDNKV